MCTSAAVGDAGGDVVPGGGLPGRVRRVARQAHRHEQTDTRAVVRLQPDTIFIINTILMEF